MKRFIFSHKRMFHQQRYVPYASHIPQDSAQWKWRDSEEFTVRNPATGQDICVVESTSPGDVTITIEAAHAAFTSGIWSKSSTLHRSKVLSRLARLLEERIPDMAMLETLQTGRTIREMRAQLARLPEWLDYYAALLRTTQSFVAPTQGKLLNYVERRPLGVVAQITPFNHPLLIAVKKIAPALAAGNSVIVKPSELAPVSLLEFAKLTQEAGIPESVFSVLPGYGGITGKAIVGHFLVRKVDVTAGTQTGRMIGSIVGGNLAAYTAELGGKAPIVVFSDADLVSAVNGVTFASFVTSGQTCVSGTRILVQDDLYDAFLNAFLDKVRGIRKGMGNPANAKSTMGTVISLSHLERIENMISRATAKNPNISILLGGSRMHGHAELAGETFDFSQGAFFEPTVITGVELEDELWVEEVFGPVVVIKKFSTESEGVSLANACKYGLGAGIWTRDVSRAHRIAAEIDAGVTWVNTHHRNDPSSPWGGMKESGIGRENGIEAFESYSQSKSTIINIATVEETRLTDDWFAEDKAGVARRYG